MADPAAHHQTKKEMQTPDIQAKVQTAMRELTTPPESDSPLTLPPLWQRKLNEGGWKTLNDPKLEEMETEAKTFLHEIWKQREPRWLTFIGPCGTGKTFLSKIIFECALTFLPFREHRVLIRPVLWDVWPRTLKQLRSGNYDLADQLSMCNFVFLDEITVDHDPSGFGKDQLAGILSARINKWTLITSNLSLDKFREIDERIASRLVRDRNVVCVCDTQDYATR